MRRLVLRELRRMVMMGKSIEEHIACENCSYI